MPQWAEEKDVCFSVASSALYLGSILIFKTRFDAFHLCSQWALLKQQQQQQRNSYIHPILTTHSYTLHWNWVIRVDLSSYFWGCQTMVFLKSFWSKTSIIGPHLWPKTPLSCSNHKKTPDLQCFHTRLIWKPGVFPPKDRFIWTYCIWKQQTRGGYRFT